MSNSLPLHPFTHVRVMALGHHPESLETGRLFKNPQRCLIDLAMELRMRAACNGFLAASGNEQSVNERLRRFVGLRLIATMWKSVGIPETIAVR